MTPEEIIKNPKELGMSTNPREPYLYRKLVGARSRRYRSQILQVNIRWRALDEIYKICKSLYRSELKIFSLFPCPSFLNLLFESDSYSNECFLVKLGCDTAENEPRHVCGTGRAREGSLGSLTSLLATGTLSKLPNRGKDAIMFGKHFEHGTNSEVHHLWIKCM